MTDVEKEQLKNLAEKEDQKKKAANKLLKTKHFYFLKIPSGFWNTPEVNAFYYSAAGDQNPVVEGQLRKFAYCLLLDFSIKGNGYICNGSYPYTPELLAMMLNLPVNTLVETIKTGIKSNVIHITENGEIYMDQFEELVATSSEEALRKAKERRNRSMSENDKKILNETIRIAKTKWLNP